MSVQNIRAFWEKAQQDPALQQQLREIKGDAKEAVVADIVRVAAEAGFSFTAQEYEATVKEDLARRHAAGELFDEELSSVAGASAPSPGCVKHT